MPPTASNGAPRTTRPPGRPPRRLAWAGAALSVVALFVSGYALAKRIADYNESLDRKIYYFIEGDNLGS